MFVRTLSSLRDLLPFPTVPSAEALGYYRLPLRGMNLLVSFHCIVLNVVLTHAPPRRMLRLGQFGFLIQPCGLCFLWRCRDYYDTYQDEECSQDRPRS